MLNSFSRILLFASGLGTAVLTAPAQAQLVITLQNNTTYTYRMLYHSTDRAKNWEFSSPLPPGREQAVAITDCLPAERIIYDFIGTAPGLDPRRLRGYVICGVGSYVVYDDASFPAPYEPDPPPNTQLGGDGGASDPMGQISRTQGVLDSINQSQMDMIHSIQNH